MKNRYYNYNYYKTSSTNLSQFLKGMMNQPTFDCKEHDFMAKPKGQKDPCNLNIINKSLKSKVIVPLSHTIVDADNPF